MALWFIFSPEHRSLFQNGALPRKILILDDSMADREMCRRFLARSAPEGTYQCSERPSLEGAREAVRALNPHCVLLDYHFKDGTGMEFLGQIQAMERVPEFAVVMLTGEGSGVIAADSIKKRSSGLFDQGQSLPRPAS